MPKSKPTCTPSFKREVLADQAGSGHSQKEVAGNFGVTPNSLREWQRRAQAPPGAPEPGVARESPESELCRLRREDRELRMRGEILKKRRASSAVHPRSISGSPTDESGLLDQPLVRDPDGVAHRLFRVGERSTRRA